jgi:hypothetical protein
MSSTKIIIDSQAHYVIHYNKPLFKLIKYKTVVFDEVYILFRFNIILKHNGMSSTKKRYKFIACLVEKYKSEILILMGCDAAYISI